MCEEFSEQFTDGFYTHARETTANHQNTMGVPLQFNYENGVPHPVHTGTAERVGINLSPINSFIPQNSLKDPITGVYTSMVYDVPFDKKQDKKTNENLLMYGFGFAALSSMF